MARSRKRTGRKGFPYPERVGLLVVLAVSMSSCAAGSRVPSWWHPAGGGSNLPGGIWIAGDVTLAGGVPEEREASFEVDDLRLLARYEPTARLALFGDLRVEDLVEVVEGRGVETDDREVVIERLYAEALLTPSLTLRLGKIFTPFGLWNVIHRAPLTWTVEEPAATEDVFPTHTTGLSLLLQTTWYGWSFDATMYGPAQDELTLRHSTHEGWLVGTRVAAGRDLGAAYASVGVNAAGFRGYERSDWATATGLDLEVSIAGHQLTGELTFRVPARGGQAVQGLYLQDAIPLEPLMPVAREVYGVVRFEEFQPHRGGAAVGGLLGLFWRPLPSLILKADYLFGNRTLENFEPGFQSSISLLF